MPGHQSYNPDEDTGDDYEAFAADEKRRLTAEGVLCSGYGPDPAAGHGDAWREAHAVPPRLGQHTFVYDLDDRGDHPDRCAECGSDAEDPIHHA